MFSPDGGGVLRGWDASFGNSGSVVTIVAMVCHAMGTIGLVVCEKRGRSVRQTGL